MKKNNKGFTLAELLIVVAIIAVLAAIAIPTFSSQLEKAKEATDIANLRAAYAEVMTKYLTDGEASTKSVAMTQGTNGWVTKEAKIGDINISGMTTTTGQVDVVCSETGVVTVGGISAPSAPSSTSE